MEKFPVPELIVIPGSMFSGKTDEALRVHIRRHVYARERVLAIQPRADSRSPGFIRSRMVTEEGTVVITGEFPATVVDTAGKFQELIPLIEENHVLVADEAQFFGSWFVKSILDLIQLSLKCSSLKIVVVGLDLDYSGKPFEVIRDLMPHADRVYKQQAICFICGNKAVHTQYLGTPGGGRVIIGDTGEYQARCRNCYEPVVTSN